VQLSAFITLTLHKTARKNTASIFTLVAMAVTTAIPHSTPKKSWADIVKGRSESKVEPLRPAARGTHRSLCTGEFLVMLGHYGWIMALQDIDHPDADRHGGRIYLRASDLRPGYTPKQGDEVTFFLYADDNGLGAEDCFATSNPHPPLPPAPSKRQGCGRPKINWGIQAQQTEAKKCMNAQAKEFVPTVLVPLESLDHADRSAGGENIPICMNPGAKEFVPAPPGLGLSLNAEAMEFAPSHPCCINAKRFYDDDDDSSDDGTESTASDFSGHVLVAPGLSACFVGGKPEQWSSLSSRCSQAVKEVDTDSDSWCDDEADDDASVDPAQNRAEEWAALSARCAQAVHQAASCSLGFVLPPGLAPPGLEPPGCATMDLVPPGLA
jgi:hypothetical protein